MYSYKLFMFEFLRTASSKIINLINKFKPGKNQIVFWIPINILNSLIIPFLCTNCTEWFTRARSKARLDNSSQRSCKATFLRLHQVKWWDTQLQLYCHKHSPYSYPGAHRHFIHTYIPVTHTIQTLWQNYPVMLE